MKTLKIRQISGLVAMLTFLLTLESGCTYAFNGIKGNGNVVKQERKFLTSMGWTLAALSGYF